VADAHGRHLQPEDPDDEPLRLECRHFLALVAAKATPAARTTGSRSCALEQLQVVARSTRLLTACDCIADRDRLSRDGARRGLQDPRLRVGRASSRRSRRARPPSARSCRRSSSAPGTIVSTGAVVFAGTTVGERVIVGDQACVRERCTIGDDVVIGRGSLVENDTSSAR
jgi:hypothetical protein